MQSQLSAQKTNLKDYIDKIQGLEEELKKTEDLFGDSQKQLEKTKQHLNWTIQDRDEHRELVEKHAENEDVLFSQASSLLETVEETVTDTNYLHQSLNRNKSLHKENLGTSETFRVKTQQKLNVLNDSLTNQCNLQNQFSKSLTNKFCKKIFILFAFFSSFVKRKILHFLSFSFQWNTNRLLRKNINHSKFL